jgi:tetratricopeptide (TPR) repeat protein
MDWPEFAQPLAASSSPRVSVVQHQFQPSARKRAARTDKNHKTGWTRPFKSDNWHVQSKKKAYYNTTAPMPFSLTAIRPHRNDKQALRERLLNPNNVPNSSVNAQGGWTDAYDWRRAALLRMESSKMGSAHKLLTRLLEVNAAVVQGAMAEVSPMGLAERQTRKRPAQRMSAGDISSVASTYQLLAICNSHLDQNAGAVKDASLAILLAPTEDVPYSTRAFAYCALGQFKLAGLDCDTALRLNPHNESALATRSSVLIHGGKFDLAIEDAKQALALDRDNEAARANFLTAHEGKANAEFKPVMLTRSAFLKTGPQPPSTSSYAPTANNPPTHPASPRKRRMRKGVVAPQPFPMHTHTHTHTHTRARRRYTDPIADFSIAARTFSNPYRPVVSRVPLSARAYGSVGSDGARVPLKRVNVKATTARLPVVKRKHRKKKKEQKSRVIKDYPHQFWEKHSTE